LHHAGCTTSILYNNDFGEDYEVDMVKMAKNYPGIQRVPVMVIS